MAIRLLLGMRSRIKGMRMHKARSELLVLLVLPLLLGLGEVDEPGADGEVGLAGPPELDLDDPPDDDEEEVEDDPPDLDEEYEDPPDLEEEPDVPPGVEGE